MRLRSQRTIRDHDRVAVRGGQAGSVKLRPGEGISYHPRRGEPSEADLSLVVLVVAEKTDVALQRRSP